MPNPSCLALHSSVGTAWRTKSMSIKHVHGIGYNRDDAPCVCISATVHPSAS